MATAVARFVLSLKDNARDSTISNGLDIDVSGAIYWEAVGKVVLATHFWF